jgi:peroxiredoxin
MSIQIGQALPNNTLYEFIEEETPGCAIGPNAFQVADMVKGKKIVIFGLPCPRFRGPTSGPEGQGCR